MNESLTLGGSARRRTWASIAGVGMLVSSLFTVRQRNLLLVAATLSSSLAIGGCGGDGGDAAVQQVAQEGRRSGGYSGSASCRECHESFYQLWAPSRHGLAMQPVTPELAGQELEPTDTETPIGRYMYGVDFDRSGGWMRERGPTGDRRLRIEYALGGKNVYYFLTPLERGRLQVLPLAFDVRRGEWYDATESMVRHFSDASDRSLHWTDRLLTFNTACHGCHVSQLSTNYDVESDSYSTTWVEPGINCETCHGPAEEHIRASRAAGEGREPEDLKIISLNEFTAVQTNDACAICHAKGRPITSTFQPGESYFDHYDLVGFEHPDFYPDGRDLGENYTLTLWLTSPCLRSGSFDCLYCHTSSGQYRFTDDPNAACAPCHEERVREPRAHTHHDPTVEGGLCVSCHMPRTSFARMVRSDHSLRPPMPAATREFGSPNACNLCHDGRDVDWADRWAREWWGEEYQEEALRVGRLIEAARSQDWSRLPEMLAYLESGAPDAVRAASLIRLLMACEDERKWPVIIAALEDPSPLVRAAGAEALTGNVTRETVGLLAEAVRDESRLVRIRAASALAAAPDEMIPSHERRHVRSAMDELVAALGTRADDWRSRLALGNFHFNRGEYRRAIEAYERGYQLEPRATSLLVNAATAYKRVGEDSRAEAALLTVLESEPDNATALLSLGLLLGESGRKEAALAAFRDVVTLEPESDVAAHNLCVLLGPLQIGEAIEWCRRAVELQPREPSYAYTLAYYLREGGDVPGAVAVLEQLMDAAPAYIEAYVLLADIHVKRGDLKRAERLLGAALSTSQLSNEDVRRLEAELQSLKSRSPGG